MPIVLKCKKYIIQYAQHDIIMIVLQNMEANCY